MQTDSQGLAIEPNIHDFRTDGMSEADVRAEVHARQLKSETPSAGALASAASDSQDATIARVKEIMATCPVRAAGYRLKVRLIESEHGLSAGEAEIAPTLAKLGLVTKTNNQKSREDRGTDTALIVDVGPAAWCQKQAYGPDPWAKVGMVIKMIRYTGHAYEEPPGSGKRYALINDEDVLGYYEETVNG